MIALILASLAAGAASPAVVDGNRLVAGRQCFQMLREGKPLGFTRQTVEATTSVLGPAWSVTIEQVMVAGGFTFNDHFLLKRDNLQPIAFHSDLRGQEIARLMYRDGRIVGWKRDKTGIEAVDLPTEGPVLEGNLFGPMLTAMTLRDGASYRPLRYQYHEGLGPFAIDVRGEETIDTPRGRKNVWKVAIGFSPDKQATYLIGKDDGVEYGYRGAIVSQAMIADCRPVEAALKSIASATPTPAP